MSNKHKSSIVGAAGFLAAFNHNLFTAAQQAGVSEERLYDLLNNDANVVARIVRVFVEATRSPAELLAAMITVCRFRYASPGITDELSLDGRPVADVKDMVTFTEKDLGYESKSSAQIVARLDQKGCRPATFAELLVYANTKWNGRDQIVAFGSMSTVEEGSRFFPYISGDDGGRDLQLGCCVEDCWCEDWQYLAVPKQSPGSTALCA